MKSVGEAMGIGRTFTEAFLKAMRSRELDGATATPWLTLDDLPGRRPSLVPRPSSTARSTTPRAAALPRRPRRGRLARAQAARALGRRDRRGLRRRRGDGARARGSPAASARSTGAWTRAPPRSRPRPTTSTPPGARPTRRARPGEKPVALILGSGPNRIGQGIEFDYCCVHAAKSFRELGYEAVMVNCNPETVSTDYDTSDRLYFEPLDAEAVLEICARERPAGVAVQFGGQTPLKLATRARGGRLRDPRDAARRGRPRRGPRALRRALRRARHRRSARGRWRRARRKRSRPRSRSATRSSSAPRTSSADARCASATSPRTSAAGVEPGMRVLVDRFIESALELDVDALCDGERTYVAAVMQHVEEAGVHSGDSSCVLPAISLSDEELERGARRRAPAGARARRASGS